MYNAQKTPPTFDPKALAALYEKHFGQPGEEPGPKEILAEMLFLISAFSPKAEVPSKTMDYLSLVGFFDDLFSPVLSTRLLEYQTEPAECPLVGAEEVKDMGTSMAAT